MDGNEPQRSQHLTATERVVFEQLAECLVPSQDDKPGAGSVGIVDLVESVLSVRDDLIAGLRELLRDAESARDQQQYLRTLYHSKRDTFEEFAWLVVTSYTMHRDVRRRLKYPGQMPREIQSGESDDVVRALLQAEYMHPEQA